MEVETKTSDDVTVVIGVCVQYEVIYDKANIAFYKLNDPRGQMTSYVFDVTRACVPTMELDAVFAEKSKISTEIQSELATPMANYGYRIVKSLITNIDPDPDVKASMNEKNAAKRRRLAAEEIGEGEKIIKVKAAEAESASKILQGEGIAGQRKAIVDGLKDSVAAFKNGVPGSSAKDVMQLVLMTQYFDTLKDIGATSKSNAVFVPHSPGGFTDIGAQIRDSILQANAVDTPTEDSTNSDQTDENQGDQTKNEEYDEDEEYDDEEE